MHRIEGANYTVVSGKKQFIESDFSTRVTAEWLNAIQEEICSVIEGAGLVLKDGADSDTHDQLFEAVRLMGAAFSMPSGSEMLVYADAAPIGWTILTGVDDCAVITTKGSEDGGNIGGGPHPTGTWQNPGHTLVESELPRHRHGTNMKEITWAWAASNPRMTYAVLGSEVTSSVGGSGAHDHGNAWRPQALCFILCRKNTL